jgi:O-acetylserine/cysteine efflux transporter
MPARHIALAVAVAVVWGVNFVVVHVGLESFPPLLFAALRFTLVALPAVFFVARPPIPIRYIVGVGLFLSGGQFALLFISMDRGMPAGLASLVLQLQALFTIGLAVGLLGERLNRGQAAGAALALGGMAVIAAGRAEEVPLGALALCVGAALSWGAGNVIVRRAQAPGAMSLLVWSSLVPPVVLAALSLWLEGPERIGDALTSASTGGILALLYIVVLATVFGFGSWTWLIRRHPASRVAPFTLLVPPVGIVTAWIALGERPNGAELIGAVVVLAGLYVTTRSISRPAPAGAARSA